MGGGVYTGMAHCPVTEKLLIRNRRMFPTHTAAYILFSPALQTAAASSVYIGIVGCSVYYHRRVAGPYYIIMILADLPSIVVMVATCTGFSPTPFFECQSRLFLLWVWLERVFHLLHQAPATFRLINIMSSTFTIF